SRIAYFGPVGTFTGEAARTFMAAGDELVAAETIPK
nr:prephenate dehydratase, PDT {N-terminal} [Amycolatopsis methanolica, NCIB 11946, Peptide Partial, 35 aa] [Amycolatopsis methanolica]